jgi:hypothetical protein
MKRRPVLIAVLLPLGACGASGALHQATLAGQCASDDVACSRRHPQAPIAIGTRFFPDVAVDIAGNTTPNLILESADPDVLAVEDGALVARAPGASAVLIATEDGSIVDFVHVWVAPVTRMTLARRDGERIEGSVGLTVGEDLTVVPTLWNGSQRLAGAGEVSWQSSDGAALAVLHDGTSDRRRLRARAPGKATITVALGDARATLDVEVVP